MQLGQVVDELFVGFLPVFWEVFDFVLLKAVGDVEGKLLRTPAFGDREFCLEDFIFDSLDVIAGPTLLL